MRHAILRILAVSSGITGLFAVGYPAQVRAQTIFCPANFANVPTGQTASPDQTNGPPVVLSNGSCTDGHNGAFSGAALASQALSEVSETTTETTTREIGKAIVERREQERERVRRPVRPTREVPREKPKPAEVVVKAPPLLPIEPAVRFGTWTQVFGDYQKRDAAGPALLNCCTLGNPPIPFNGIQPNLALNLDSRASTIGFVAGADLTSRGLYSAGDGFIAGLTAGYTSSELKMNTTATGLPTAGVTNNDNRLPGTGVSHLRATVSGPTLGAYGTYFNGGFSSDVAVKFDFLTLNQTFNDLLATTITANPFVSIAGAGSVNLLDSTVVGNLNYRFDLSPNSWIEPTVGVEYTNSSYGSGAAQLGLADGNLVRVQGGARFGTSTFSNGVLMTTTVTGLAYNDVVAQGGFIPAAAFAGNNLLVQADRGLMRGQGILALNFDFGYGMSSFVQGDVYGGAHLIGAGGRAGIRYEW